MLENPDFLHPKFFVDYLLEEPGSLKLQTYLYISIYLPTYLLIYCSMNTEAKHFHYVNEIFPTQGLSLLSGKAVMLSLT